MARAKNIKCPGCEEGFGLEGDLEIGDTTVCPNCYAELKIIELDPPILKVSQDNDATLEEKDNEEEDYDDEEDDDDDDADDTDEEDGE
jgi:hypothetical protein